MGRGPSLAPGPGMRFGVGVDAGGGGAEAGDAGHMKRMQTKACKSSKAEMVRKGSPLAMRVFPAEARASARGIPRHPNHERSSYRKRHP